VDGIAVEVLLRSHREIQRLKWERAPPIELAEQIENAAIGGDRANVVVIGPSVLDALHLSRILDGLGISHVDVELGAEIGLDTLYPLVKRVVRKINDGIAAFVQIRCNAAFFRTELKLIDDCVK
jgi:hypothetical protein